MRASLERLGYSVQAVDNGRAALDAVDDTSFDVIVLDVEMPDLDGMAVGRALRSSQRAATAAIAMHSSVAEDVVRGGFDQYDAYVAKSANLRLLGEQIDRLVRSRRMTKERPGSGSTSDRSPA